MVLARVANVKSGWKTMFMVFTTAAIDESPQIVRLAFETIEKIVREYFHYITGGEKRQRAVGLMSCLCAAYLLCVPLFYGSDDFCCLFACLAVTCLRAPICGHRSCGLRVWTLPPCCFAEVETTTFTDCVNCLIAYTNNPHSLDVSLNAIAFLRFCAMKLAEGGQAVSC